MALFRPTQRPLQFRGLTSPLLWRRLCSGLLLPVLVALLLVVPKPALAASADTSSNAGLQRVLQDTTLALLRHPDLWVYASAEVGQVPFAAAESTFNRLSMTERSKLSREVTSNVAGQKLADRPGLVGNADAASDYIAVTVLVASRSRLTLKALKADEDLRESLRLLGSVSSTDLLALEVIWQPEGAGEVLSTEELLTAYPNLQHL